MGMNTAKLYGKEFEEDPVPSDYIDAIEHIEHDLRQLHGHWDRESKRKRERLRLERNALESVLRRIHVSEEIREAHGGRPCR